MREVTARDNHEVAGPYPAFSGPPVPVERPVANRPPVRSARPVGRCFRRARRSRIVSEKLAPAGELEVDVALRERRQYLLVADVFRRGRAAAPRSRREAPTTGGGRPRRSGRGRNRCPSSTVWESWNAPAPSATPSVPRIEAPGRDRHVVPRGRHPCHLVECKALDHHSSPVLIFPLHSCPGESAPTAAGLAEPARIILENRPPFSRSRAFSAERPASPRLTGREPSRWPLPSFVTEIAQPRSEGACSNPFGVREPPGAVIRDRTPWLPEAGTLDDDDVRRASVTTDRAVRLPGRARRRYTAAPLPRGLARRPAGAGGRSGPPPPFRAARVRPIGPAPPRRTRRQAQGPPGLPTPRGAAAVLPAAGRGNRPEAPREPLRPRRCHSSRTPIWP